MSEIDRTIAGSAVVTRRLDYIDGLRAVAALWVALHHVIVTAEPKRLMALPVLGPLLSSLFFGQCAVIVFLLISGFCLYYPCVAKNPQNPTFSTSYRTYLVRRFTRIAPPYYWAGAFCLIMTAFPQLMIGAWSTAGPVDAGVIATHLIFVHNLIPAHSVKIDYPMWSIGLEWQLYLFFPLLVWAFRKANPWLVAAGALLLAGAIRAVYRGLPPALGSALREGPLSYLQIFCLGMIIAAITVRRQRVAPNWLLACVAIGGLLSVRLGSGGGLVHDVSAAAFACAVLLLATDSSSAVARMLNSPWLVAVGVFSYSIYLIHAPLLHLAWYFLRPLELSGDVQFGILTLGLGPIVLTCYVFHRLFERPFMRPHKVPSTLSTPVAVAAVAARGRE